MYQIIAPVQIYALHILVCENVNFGWQFVFPVYSNCGGSRFLEREYANKRVIYLSFILISFIWLWTTFFLCVFRCRYKLMFFWLKLTNISGGTTFFITVQTQLTNSLQTAGKFGSSFPLGSSFGSFLRTKFIITNRLLAQFVLKLKAFSRGGSCDFRILFAAVITIVQFQFTISPPICNLHIYVWTLVLKSPSF